MNLRENVFQVNNMTNGHFVSLMYSTIYLLPIVKSNNIKEPEPGFRHKLSEITITFCTMVSYILSYIFFLKLFPKKVVSKFFIEINVNSLIIA